MQKRQLYNLFNSLLRNDRNGHSKMQRYYPGLVDAADDLILMGEHAGILEVVRYRWRSPDDLYAKELSGFYSNSKTRLKIMFNQRLREKTRKLMEATDVAQ
jgi:hypothetical protein